MPGNMKIDQRMRSFFESSIDQEFDLIKAKRIGRPLNDWLKTLIFGIIASVHFKQNMLDSGGVPSLIKKDLFEKIKFYS